MLYEWQSDLPSEIDFQNLVRGQIFGTLFLLDEEAESLRYFFGAKLHASTLREKYERRSPRPLKCCIKKVTNFVTELPEIPNDLPGESDLLIARAFYKHNGIP